MKKVILTLFLLLIVGCSIKQGTNKTNYNIGELAKIDHFSIICENFEKIKIDNNQVDLKLYFKITNNSKNDILLNPNNYFKLKIDDEVYESKSNIITIKSKKTENYVLEYTIKDKDQYNLLFYSNIVSNNIGFTIK